MNGRQISDLPSLRPHGDTVFLAENMRASGTVTLGSIVEAIKKDMGFLTKPLTKCQHCGQWGAVYCECVKCGAPIDPDE